MLPPANPNLTVGLIGFILAVGSEDCENSSLGLAAAGLDSGADLIPSRLGSEQMRLVNFSTSAAGGTVLPVAAAKGREQRGGVDQCAAAAVLQRCLTDSRDGLSPPLHAESSESAAAGGRADRKCCPQAGHPTDDNCALTELGALGGPVPATLASVRLPLLQSKATDGRRLQLMGNHDQGKEQVRPAHVTKTPFIEQLHSAVGQSQACGHTNIAFLPSRPPHPLQRPQ